MSIKQNDELLRIEEDGFDVVFNYDENTPGGVSAHAERDGHPAKISDEYAKGALVKQIGAGGGTTAPMIIDLGDLNLYSQDEVTVWMRDLDITLQDIYSALGFDSTTKAINNPDGVWIKAFVQYSIEGRGIAYRTVFAHLTSMYSRGGSSIYGLVPVGLYSTPSHLWMVTLDVSFESGGPGDRISIHAYKHEIHTLSKFIA